MKSKFNKAAIKLALLVILGLFIFTPSQSSSQTIEEALASAEHILNFRSDIVINNDSSMLVKESIKVVALNQEIKHGIYRDFPTMYKDAKGNNYNVTFDVVSVLKDGSPEEFRIENKSNGKRVYIGNKNVYVPMGIHTYELTYKTTRQIGFFKDYDELYWNVTGNGWIFNIDSAEAHIKLPKDISNLDISKFAYTGETGSKDQNYKADISDNIVNFYTTSALNAKEGLTVAVGFPKGVLIEPTESQKLSNLLFDNFMASIALLILIFVCLYYIRTWNRVGVDPKPRTIIAQYEASRSLSPASMGYISKMGFSNKQMVASIINMAVKGYLKIDELRVNYRLTKTDKNNEGLSEEEKVIAGLMFKEKDIFEIKKENYTDIIELHSEMKKNISDRFKEDYFVKNWSYLAVGMFISVIGIFFEVFNEQFIEPVVLIFIVIWVILWTPGIYTMFSKGVIESWKRNKIQSIFSAIFACAFVAVELFVLYILSSQTSLIFIGYLLVSVSLNVIFAILLPRRTVMGRLIQDEIEGFKLFLSVTEKDRMNFHNPPEKTPELFEKFLPYALVLGVENKWAEQFEDVFNKLGPNGYHPNWYHGSALNAGSLSGLSSGISKGMLGSIASSSVAPGSASGSGGGGFSGGGGGGGGGGA